MTLVPVALVGEHYDLTEEAICCNDCARRWRRPVSGMMDHRNLTFFIEHYASHHPAAAQDDDDEAPF